ncbi:MAG TPA: ATP-grasp domain-containing protein [Candidatus Saccharimonadales bacterium]|nr:ATP-grasp domain-containing protein [Candidatus Saccharimonadales bacterium]
MNLLEYEAKKLLHQAGLPVPKSTLVAAPQRTLSAPIVLKSQVPTGGRGKLGGIIVVERSEDIKKTVSELFERSIKGFIPRTLLAEEKIAIKKELYISLFIDQETASIRLMAHTKGGIEVEDNTTTGFFNEAVDAATVQKTIKKLAQYFGYSVSMLQPFIEKLYAAFISLDATLIEINPLIEKTNGELVCGDCKMELDDMAAFRHPEWNFEEKPQNTNFVTLHEDGTVATIANGAGLAMATVDAVAAKSMMPANFLDIGGGANAENVLAAFNQIMAFENVKAIVINIFAGITHCDEVAKAVIEAKKQIPHLPPLFIRLAGTNFEAAEELLSAENIATLATLDECLEAAKEVVYA